MKELYQSYKVLLFTLAYQLTGSILDAEDAVQDVFIKVHDIQVEQIEEPKAYLCKMVTNRCLDLLKSARRKREQYFGPWLPEPLYTPEEDSFHSVIRSDLLSYAMLVLLERLSPAERAVFVLREALSFEYETIAELVGKSEANCRKLLSRARGKMGISEEEEVHVEEAGEEWVRRFIEALQMGHIETLLSLLAEDVILTSDGGGKAWAATRPVETRDRVARFLFGLFQKAIKTGIKISFELKPLNGQIGFTLQTDEGIETVGLVHVENEKIQNLYLLRNPDKLSRIKALI